MTKNKAKNWGMGSILGYLDNQINGYYQKTGNYPNLILMNKETKDEIFAELGSVLTIYEGWAYKKDNYRGIPLEIRDISFIKLEG